MIQRPVWLSIKLIPEPIRRIIGLAGLIIGIIGAIMPIIPGWPGFFVAVVFLGRRDRMLRRTHLLGRHGLRWLRHRHTPWLRLLGKRLTAEYLRGRRTVGPALDAVERAVA